MQLQQLLKDTVSEMDRALERMVELVPPARSITFRDSFVYRHVEHLPQQAIVQKMSRIPSGLRAAQLLCDAGYFQEQSSLQRIIDELGEDVIFLSVPIIFGNESQIHRKYLDAFFAEEYDPVSGKPVPEQRPMIPRKKIRAAIANSPLGTQDPSSHMEAGKTISKAYSGFVHGASPHIMDTYGGNPPRFHTAGMLGTIREVEHRQDIVNYYFRGLSAYIIGARAIGHQPVFDRLYQLSGVYNSLGVG